MNGFKNVLQFLINLIIILLQGAVGMAAGTLAVGLTKGEMPASLIYTGLGIWLGVIIMGAVALSIRKTFRGKKIMARLLGSLLGVAIPIIYLIYVGATKGYDSPIISDGLGIQMTILAAMLGILGFYAPGWFIKR